MDVQIIFRDELNRLSAGHATSDELRRHLQEDTVVAFRLGGRWIFAEPQPAPPVHFESNSSVCHGMLRENRP